MPARTDGLPKMFKVKQCAACHVRFQGTGPRSKFCPACAEFRLLASKRYLGTGEGSGGWNRGRPTIHNYRTRFLTLLHVKQNGMCAECFEELPEVLLLVHHKDHNRHNNDETNLSLVCKRCHQIEHECWLAFSKV